MEMDKMKMMQDKFLMLAEKLAVDPALIKQISEDFAKQSESDSKGDVVVEKTVEISYPSEEEMMGMEKEQLLELMKKMMAKQMAKKMAKKMEYENVSPLEKMMRKNSY